MRGSAVPTMVWSSAARNSASATPTVARMRALRVISAGIGSLLGHGFDRVVEVRKGGAQADALLRGEVREHTGHTPLHDLAVLVELAAPRGGQLDEHDPPITGVLEATDETVARERIDELGERGRRHRAALREIAAPHRALPELPHHPGAVRRDWTVFATRSHRHLAEARQRGQEKSRELEIFGLRWDMTFDKGGHWFGLQIVKLPKYKGSAARAQAPRVSRPSQKRANVRSSRPRTPRTAALYPQRKTCARRRWGTSRAGARRARSSRRPRT